MPTACSNSDSRFSKKKENPGRIHGLGFRLMPGSARGAALRFSPQAKEAVLRNG
jgi:hypothetical protein